LGCFEARLAKLSDGWKVLTGLDKRDSEEGYQRGRALTA